MGTTVSFSAVGRDVQLVQKAYRDHKSDIDRDLADHTTIESWARESYASAVTHAYAPAVAGLEGELRNVPYLPEDYASQAGLVAQQRIYKAGSRLAQTLREVVDE